MSAEAEAAVARVAALHQRRRWDWTRDMMTFGQTEFPDQCTAWGCREWPCATVQALGDALSPPAPVEVALGATGDAQGPQIGATDLRPRVHNHPPWRPMCGERFANGVGRGDCLNDDGTDR